MLAANHCPLAAGGHPPTDQEIVDRLLDVFAERLRRRMKCLPSLLAGVSGGAGKEYVCGVGDYFKAQGLTRPTLQLLHACWAGHMPCCPWKAPSRSRFLVKGSGQTPCSSSA